MGRLKCRFFCIFDLILGCVPKKKRMRGNVVMRSEVFLIKISCRKKCMSLKKNVNKRKTKLPVLYKTVAATTAAFFFHHTNILKKDTNKR